MKLLPWLMIRFQKIECGRHCTFCGMPVIVKSQDSRITIGNGCRIRSGFLTNLIGLYQRTIIVAKNGAQVTLEDGVGMSGVTIYARNGIAIGEKTLIGANTKILDNDFHPVDPAVRWETPGSNIPAAPIHIGKNCFIGCNAIILKGTVLGDGCVVGAGAVVSGKYEDNSVITGNPARVIRKLDK